MVELSHPITDDMPAYPGLPGPTIGDHLTREQSRAHYAPGTEFHIGTITMVANTGTYLDAPFHRYPDGVDLAGLALHKVADLDGVLVRVTGVSGRAIDASIFAPLDVTGKAVLVHTGWARHWGNDAYFGQHPYLTGGAAAWLVERGAALVGIDSLNIDETTARGPRPVHTELLAAGIPIVEHLCGLESLPANGFRFHAAPVAVVGMGTFPVRAYAVLDG